MKAFGPLKLVKLFAATLSALLLVSLLVPMQRADASQQYSTPCPRFAIQDVFNDPGSDWDRDGVNNSDELYNGLNPCVVDTGTFCGSGGNPLCVYRTYGYYTPTACERAITSNPNGDYDGDGVSNAVELRNYANPCAHPCPNPTNADLALNPNGSWDNDGISNAIEVWQGTDPCNGYSYAAYYNPCPAYTYRHVNAMPNHDWDNDGIRNAHDTQPCVANYVQRLPHVTHVKHAQRLPHVTYVAPAPPQPICPRGYPYYHRGNGLCYANPVGNYWAW